MNHASRALILYGIAMALALLLAFCISLEDDRTIREVGVWSKPMKFMTATAIFSWTTVWLVYLTNSAVARSKSFNWIAALVITTSVFEVVYITFQGAQALPSHYNNTDSLHRFLFGVMAFAAIGLTFSQVWLAWVIWREQRTQGISVVTLGVLVGLVLTFLLATVSGFLLGGNQPPSGQGLPIVGWHLHKDLRPAHFLGVHAQQLIPLLALFANRYFRNFAFTAVISGSFLYLAMWAWLVWFGLHAR
jgi:magnesium-transporting ATPase (P-type)